MKTNTVKWVKPAKGLTCSALHLSVFVLCSTVTVRRTGVRTTQNGVKRDEGNKWDCINYKLESTMHHQT